MIVILDDTFIERHKFHDIEYLNTDKYIHVCTIVTRLKTTEINKLLKNHLQIEFFGYHKSLQLYNNEDIPLKVEENTKFREVLLNNVSKENIDKVEFSRGLETIYDSNKIDKDLFYTNLKAFLDYFIEYNRIEPKVLFWGVNFQKLERIAAIQKALIQMRLTHLENFINNPSITKGLDLIYGENRSKVILSEWLKNNRSKNDIVKIINEKIYN